MENSLLMSISEDIEEISKTLSRTLQLNISVVDNEFLYIVNPREDELNTKKQAAKETNALNEVIKSKKALFIKTPREEEVCSNCDNLKNCNNLCVLHSPIMFEEEVVGIISLSASTSKQKEEIIINLKDYINILENIGELIFNRLKKNIDYEETNMVLDVLYKLLNIIKEGVIIFDGNDDIIYINHKAELILGNTLQQINYLQKINQFQLRKALIDNNLELNIRMKGKVLKFNGKIYSIGVGKKINKIFIFEEVELGRQKIVYNDSIENFGSDYLTGTSDSLIKTREQCKIFSVNKNNILIYGETGTGKEVFARLIHRSGIQSKKPFTTITCTGSSERNLDEELFGAHKNAVESAAFTNEGTLFIDEISDLPMLLQGKLMNLIYKGKLKSRIIATTNKDLKELVNKGEFRENLFYALETFTLNVPSLRHRKEDIVPLTNNFIKKYNHMEGKQIKFNKSIYNALVNYSWPGNIRELSNVVSYIITYCSGKDLIGLKDLPAGLVKKFSNPSAENFNLEENEKMIIINALNSYGSSKYSKEEIANELGISRATLYRKLKKYNIDEDSTFN